MRIAVYGAGAVGGHIAVRLGKAGHDVSVVARGEHLDAIRRDGITLTATGEMLTTHPRASDRPSELGEQDLVISTLKSNALGSLAEGRAAPPRQGHAGDLRPERHSLVVRGRPPSGCPDTAGSDRARSRRPPRRRRLPPSGLSAVSSPRRTTARSQASSSITDRTTTSPLGRPTTASRRGSRRSARFSPMPASARRRFPTSGWSFGPSSSATCRTRCSA